MELASDSVQAMRWNTGAEAELGSPIGPYCPNHGLVAGINDFLGIPVFQALQLEKLLALGALKVDGWAVGSIGSSGPSRKLGSELARPPGLLQNARDLGCSLVSDCEIDPALQIHLMPVWDKN